MRLCNTGSSESMKTAFLNVPERLARAASSAARFWNAKNFSNRFQVRQFSTRPSSHPSSFSWGGCVTASLRLCVSTMPRYAAPLSFSVFVPTHGRAVVKFRGNAVYGANRAKEAGLDQGSRSLLGCCGGGPRRPPGEGRRELAGSSGRKEMIIREDAQLTSR